MGDFISNRDRALQNRMGATQASSPHATARFLVSADGEELIGAEDVSVNSGKYIKFDPLTGNITITGPTGGAVLDAGYVSARKDLATEQNLYVAGQYLTGTLAISVANDTMVTHGIENTKSVGSVRLSIGENVNNFQRLNLCYIGSTFVAGAPHHQSGATLESDVNSPGGLNLSAAAKDSAIRGYVNGTLGITVDNSVGLTVEANVISKSNIAAPNGYLQANQVYADTSIILRQATANPITITSLATDARAVNFPDINGTIVLSDGGGIVNSDNGFASALGGITVAGLVTSGQLSTDSGTIVSDGTGLLTAQDITLNGLHSISSMGTAVSDVQQIIFISGDSSQISSGLIVATGYVPGTVNGAAVKFLINV